MFLKEQTMMLDTEPIACFEWVETHNYSSDSGGEGEQPPLPEQPTRPPEGPVISMLFTDIEKSTMMQKKFLHLYELMQDIHDRCLENAIYEFGGYIVNKVGDLYFAVFDSPQNAIESACRLQENLFQADWPDFFDEKELPKPFEGTPNELFRGIRVRVGIHVAKCGSETNPFDGHPESLICKPNIVLSVDYQGNAVSMAERIMDMGAGGEILITGAVYNAARKFLKTLHVYDHGVQKIKGLRDVHVYGIQPNLLKGRQFPALEEESESSSNKRIADIVQLLHSVGDTLNGLQRTQQAKCIRESEETLKLIEAQFQGLKMDLKGLKNHRKRRKRKLLSRQVSLQRQFNLDEILSDPKQAAKKRSHKTLQAVDENLRPYQVNVDMFNTSSI